MKKPLDKQNKVCYNKGTKNEERFVGRTCASSRMD